MNIRTLKAMMLGLLMAVAPVFGAQNAADDSAGENKLQKYGIRFVICSTGGEQLPSPLYAKMGKDYYPVTISKMMPSPRLTPEAGVIKFYASEPDKNDKTKIEPVMTINIPEAHRGSMVKSLCILQPRKKDDTEPLSFFLKESEFKRGGVHIINFTNNALEMITDPTGKFDGKEKRSKIAPRVKTQNISSSDANTWSYQGKSKDGDKLNYILRTVPTAASPEGKRIRAGVIMTMGNTSQVSIVVNHPKLKGACSLLSVQFADEELQPQNTGKAPRNAH